MTVGDFGSGLEKLSWERLDLDLTSGGLVEYNSRAKPSEPDRTVFDLQHICMKLHRGNGLRRQPEKQVYFFFRPEMWTFLFAALQTVG